MLVWSSLFLIMQSYEAQNSADTLKEKVRTSPSYMMSAVMVLTSCDPCAQSSFPLSLQLHLILFFARTHHPSGFFRSKMTVLF